MGGTQKHAVRIAYHAVGGYNISTSYGAEDPKAVAQAVLWGATEHNGGYEGRTIDAITVDGHTFTPQDLAGYRALRHTPQLKERETDMVAREPLIPEASLKISLPAPFEKRDLAEFMAAVPDTGKISVHVFTGGNQRDPIPTKYLFEAKWLVR